MIKPDSIKLKALFIVLFVTLFLFGAVYVMKYTANVNGNDLTKKETVNVTNNIFSVEGSGEISYETFKGKSGAKVTLQNGDRLVYNPVIDLAGFTDLDELFRLFVIPKVKGKADFQRFEAEITDVYDADKKIVVDFTQYYSNNAEINLNSHTYVKVEYGDSGFLGLHPDRDGAIIFENKKYSVAHSPYGSPIEFSFTGNQMVPAVDPPALGDEWIGVCYGYETNVVRVKNQSKTVPVADTDNPSMFTETFEGFTTGKVRLTIKPTNYARSSCTLFITHFAGEEVNGDNKTFTDTEKPNLTVDFEGYEVGDIPNAIAGEPYRVFNASAFDVIDGKINAEYSVFYGYNTERPVNVNVFDGKFIPKYQGVYAIKYKATDTSGNIAEQVVSVIARTANDLPLEFTIVGNTHTEFNAGETGKVIDGVTVEGSGRTAVSAVATLISDPNVRYELDDNFAFTPLYSGDYSVVFTYSDYCRSEETDAINVKVNSSDKILFSVNDETFPEYLIKNCTYDFPVVKAISLSSGTPTENIATLKISEDGRDFTDCTGSYKVAATNTVALRYYYGTKFSEIVVPVKDVGIDAVDPELVMIKNYFAVKEGDFSSAATIDGIDFFVTGLNVSDVASLRFINDLNPTEFDFSMRPSANRIWKAGAEFALYLEDVKNSENSVKFKFTVRTNGVYFSVNDVKEYYLCETFVDATDDFLSVSYSVKTGKVTANGLLAVAVPTNLQGKAFNGFTQGVRLTLAFEKGFGIGDGVRFTEINGQGLFGFEEYGGKSYDNRKPFLVHDNAFYGEKKVNDVVDILPCVAYDVLTPNVKAYLTVLDPDGNTAKDIDGNYLYEVNADVLRKIKLDKYGTYQFRIKAKDLFYYNEETTFAFAAFVIPTDKPAVNIKSAAISAEKNTSVSLSDNYSVTVGGGVDYTVYLTVKTPDGTVLYLKDTAYVPSSVGEYVVRVSVIDNNGNFGEASFRLTVGKAGK